ncbi:MAG: hypothetical protein CMJ48_05705 [Planctomycetaceae bacterium]|nr:hypothetical protein [Planctomycetaceae bacterium]
MRQISHILIVMVMFSALSSRETCGGEITAEGKAAVEQLPRTLRARITIEERGTSAADAMTKIAADQRALQEYLLALGANPRSIRFGETSVVSHKSGKFVSSYPQKRSLSVGSKAAADGKKFVTLSVEVAAEWEFASKSQPDLVVEFHTLRQRILTAYEQVKREDPKLAASFSPPSFLLVGYIDEPQRLKLLQAAFDDAKKRAGQLAKVANVELGPLLKLNTKSRLQPAAARPSTTRTHERNDLWEVMTNKPAQVSFWIEVSTIFAINQATLKQSRVPADPLRSARGRSQSIAR